MVISTWVISCGICFSFQLLLRAISKTIEIYLNDFWVHGGLPEKISSKELAFSTLKETQYTSSQRFTLNIISRPLHSSQYFLEALHPYSWFNCIWEAYGFISFHLKNFSFYYVVWHLTLASKTLAWRTFIHSVLAG